MEMVQVWGTATTGTCVVASPVALALVCVTATKQTTLLGHSHHSACPTQDSKGRRSSSGVSYLFFRSQLWPQLGIGDISVSSTNSSCAKGED